MESVTISRKVLNPGHWSIPSLSASCDKLNYRKPCGLRNGKQHSAAIRPRAKQRSGRRELPARRLFLHFLPVVLWWKCVDFGSKHAMDPWLHAGMQGGDQAGGRIADLPGIGVEDARWMHDGCPLGVGFLLPEPATIHGQQRSKADRFESTRESRFPGQQEGGGVNRIPRFAPGHTTTLRMG